MSVSTIFLLQLPPVCLPIHTHVVTICGDITICGEIGGPIREPLKLFQRHDVESLANLGGSGGRSEGPEKV